MCVLCVSSVCPMCVLCASYVHCARVVDICIRTQHNCRPCASMCKQSLFVLGPACICVRRDQLRALVESGFSSVGFPWGLGSIFSSELSGGRGVFSSVGPARKFAKSLDSCKARALSCKGSFRSRMVEFRNHWPPQRV